MSVLAEALSVIVRVATLNTEYPGGLSRYKAACPNRSFCCDGYLTRVGFMAPADVRAFVDELQDAGLILFHDGAFKDMAVVDQIAGPTASCDWLEGGRHTDGYSAVWLKGSHPVDLAVPDGWTPDVSRDMTFVSDAELSERVLPLGDEGDSDVYLDFRTGKEVYVWRSRIQGRGNGPEEPRV